MSKIYARQIAPEYQESPLYLGEEFFPEDVSIFGNRHYKGHKTELLERLPGILDELGTVWDNMQIGYHEGGTWAQELDEIAPPVNREPYTREERRDAWPHIMRNYVDERQTNEFFCLALDLITGRRWDCCTLRGCCQSDWQYCIYPADDWDGDSLERLEAEYFNTGSEWIIHDGQEAPESPEDIDGYSVYCTGWNDDLIRKEIAEAAGGKPEDVKLYKFSGYTKTAVYEEA